MTFSNPILLWTAFGILIPLAIHLWSRKKVVTIKVGSTKWLKKSEPRRTSTIRPNEWWLLLLRILTILLLTLLLAGPKIDKPIKNAPVTYLVEASLLESERMEGLLDTVPADAVRLLADGFPSITDYYGAINGGTNYKETDYDWAASDKIPPNYWQLAQEMANLPSDSIVVFTKALVSGIKGMRPNTDGSIDFVVMDDEAAVDGDNSVRRTVEAGRKGDSVELLRMVGDGKHLGFETGRVPVENNEIRINETEDSISVAGRRLPLRSNSTLSVLMVYADSLSQEMRYIKASFSAISKYLERDISVRTTMNMDSAGMDTYDVSVWLGIDPKEPDSLPHLVYWPDALAGALIQPGLQRNEYHLTGRLDSENIVSGRLAESLLGLLPLYHGLGDEVARFDSRTMDPEAFRPETTLKKLGTESTDQMDISPWLWGFLMLIMIAERILAKHRKQ